MAQKNNTTAPGGEIGRRISAKEMGFDKEVLQEMAISNKEVDHFLFRVVGMVTGLKPYTNRMEGDKQGEKMFGLLGQFEATTVDGDVKRGSVCYLPGYVQDMVIAIMSMPEAEGARIAFDVYARYDKASATSYVFVARDLLQEGGQGIAEVQEALKAIPMPAAQLALPKE